MHNLPVFIAAVLLILMVSMMFLRPFQTFFAKMKQVLSPIEDQWTWMTRDGTFYEEVQVDGIENGEVTFHHKFGQVCLPIADLSYDSQMKLERGYQQGDSKPPAIEPKAAEVSNFDDGTEKPKRPSSDTDYKAAA